MPPVLGCSRGYRDRSARATVIASLLAACGGAPARVPDPHVTARTFAAAAAEGDVDAAYAQLDPGLRASLTRDAFAAQLADNRAELQELAATLARVSPAQHAEAEVELLDGERVLLVLEDGQWRIASAVLDAQTLDTPEGAVLALRNALQRQSLPALLRVLSRERRAAWLAAFEQSLERTSDPLALEVEVQGDHAVVHLVGGGEIQLKLEAGRWRVWDVR
jgi:hypothetical protein